MKPPDADGRLLRALYKNVAGRGLVSVLMQKVTLRLVGALANARVSRLLIPSFARRRNIQLTRRYRSFNDFFSREVPVSFGSDDARLGSPCEADVTAWIDEREAQPLSVKGHTLPLSRLVNMDTSAWQGGTLYQFSLTSAHMHRMLAFDDCKIVNETIIPGEYQATHCAVRPNAQDVYFRNYRIVQVLDTQHFGKVLCVMVASMLVGSVQRLTPMNQPIVRGDTLNCFELGGSAVLMVFEKARLEPDTELLWSTKLGISTYIRAGDEIGHIPVDIEKQAATIKTTENK